MKVFIRNFLDNTETELLNFNNIAFGEGLDRVTVSARHGTVDIRTLHGRLLVVPQASNYIKVKAEPFS